MAKIFQNRQQNIEHVELSITEHCMQFLDITAPLERTIPITLARATCCDAARLRWFIPKVLRWLEIAFNNLEIAFFNMFNILLHIF